MANTYADAIDPEVYTTGMRVINRHGTTGTVTGMYRSNLNVAIDGGGSDSAPAHHRAWRQVVEVVDEVDPFDAAGELGVTHGHAAVAATIAAGASFTPDSEGAAVIWGFAADIPFPPFTRVYDAYMDGWYEAVYADIAGPAALVDGAVL